MAEAFIYMYVVGLGASLGVLTTMGIGYKFYHRGNKKEKQKK